MEESMTEDRIAALAERFRRLGCAEPDSLARTQIEEDTPELARFVFLQELWRLVIRNGDLYGLNYFAGPNDDGRGGALRRIKECGVDLKDLFTVIQEAQINVIRDLAGVLDGLNNLGRELEDVSWGLYELDSDLKPTRPIDSLHESIDDEDVQLPRHRSSNQRPWP